MELNGESTDSSNPAEGDLSLSQLVELARQGSADAENQLARYFLTQAVSATHQKLSNQLTEEDKEDIALSAVKSFCFGIRNGSIEYQGDRQLFSLLFKIVDAKVRKLWQYHFAKKRDIRKVSDTEVSGHAQFVSSGNGAISDSIIVSLQDQPAVDRILADLQKELHGLFGNLLSNLDEHPRRLLLTLLETDATNAELAKKLGRSVASIERYRQLIRQKIESTNEE